MISRGALVRQLAAPLAAAALLAACSNPAVSKAVGTVSNDGPPIVIETSSSDVTVVNHAGRPLLDVRIAIEAADTASPFVHVVPTVDAGASNASALSGFQNEDGAVLDPSANRPTRITVTARDTLAKTYDVALPWKP